MRDEKAKLKELSNNISDRSEAKGTGIMSDLLVVDGETQTLVANPHYTILLAFLVKNPISEFLNTFAGIPSFPLSMAYTTESALMHYECVTTRNGIGWLNFG